MSTEVEIYKVGSKVKLTPEVEGTINGVTIRSTGVLYECVWFNGRTRCSDWFYEHELTSDQEKIKIGFK